MRVRERGRERESKKWKIGESVCNKQLHENDIRICEDAKCYCIVQLRIKFNTFTVNGHETQTHGLQLRKH